MALGLWIRHGLLCTFVLNGIRTCKASMPYTTTTTHFIRTYTIVHVYTSAIVRRDLWLYANSTKIDSKIKTCPPTYLVGLRDTWGRRYFKVHCLYITICADPLYDIVLSYHHNDLKLRIACTHALLQRRNMTALHHLDVQMHWTSKLIGQSRRAWPSIKLPWT